MPPDEPVLCPNLRGWASDPSHIDPALDVPTLWSACETLSAMGVAHANAGLLGEWRAALVKVLAASVGAQHMAGSDEDVFAASQNLREAIYFEAMQYRRAAQRDIAAGALDA